VSAADLVVLFHVLDDVFGVAKQLRLALQLRTAELAALSSGANAAVLAAGVAGVIGAAARAAEANADDNLELLLSRAAVDTAHPQAAAASGALTVAGGCTN
jgi:hypothetical protein